MTDFQADPAFFLLFGVTIGLMLAGVIGLCVGLWRMGSHRKAHEP